MGKRKRLLILFLTAAALLLSACARRPAEQSSQSEFNVFLNQIFTNESSKDALSLHYLVAEPEKYGIAHAETGFGEFGAEAQQRTGAEAENYLAGLAAFSYKDLTDEQRLIYDILERALKASLAMSEYPLYEEVLGPTTGIQAQLPVLLAEYSLSDREDIEAYLTLLDDFDDYFMKIAEYEKEKSAAGLFMTDDTADSIIAQCRAFIADPENNYLIGCFDDRLKEITQLSEEERERYREQNRELVQNNVIGAYEHLASVLSDLKGTGTEGAGLCRLERGTEYYELLVQTRTGSDRTIDEIREMLTDALKDCLITLSGIVSRVPDIYTQYEAMEFPETDPSRSLDYLKEAVLADFPPVSGDVSCDVRYIHESLQDYLSPAMYLIPPLDDYRNNCIYLNASPAYDLTTLFPTLAHEGYPGHLYQNVYFYSRDPEPIRSLLDIAGYSEGWATYAELYSYELTGISSELAAFLQANILAAHCLYSLTDIGIHAEGWNTADTVSFLGAYGFSADTAGNIYQVMAAEPGMYLPYSVGCLEILALRDQAEEELGDSFRLLDFHTFLLNCGPAPFDLIEERMELWLSEF